MPFLSDMLDQSRRQQDEEQALARENLAEASLLQAHLSHRSALHSRFRFDPAAVMDCLRAEVLGQDPALQAVEDMLKVVRADIADPRRPLFSALFLGPTGVGKTEIVRALARALHGDAEGFCRVDMNTLSQEHYAAALTGAPPGYVGAKEGTTLLEQDKLDGSPGRPGIVLFDELEKASPEVVHALLNVLDNGLLRVASGERTYHFRNTLVFMTSNLCAHEIQRYDERRQRLPWRLLPVGGERRRRDIDGMVRARLLKTFSPEFVNRLDSVVTFNWIERDVVARLVEPGGAAAQPAPGEASLPPGGDPGRAGEDRPRRLRPAVRRPCVAPQRPSSSRGTAGRASARPPPAGRRELHDLPGEPGARAGSLRAALSDSHRRGNGWDRTRSGR